MTKKWNVYVTRMIPQEVIDELKEYCQVEVNPENRSLTKAELMEKVRGRDAVMTQAVDKVDDEVLAAAGSQCKIFANYAVGYNNFDLAAAAKRGVMMTNTPDVVTDATVEMTWALIFASARRIVESDRYVRDGKFKGLDPMLLLGTELKGKTLGVIGAGRIGRKVAMKAKAFDMNVIYYDVAPNAEFAAATDADYLTKGRAVGPCRFCHIACAAPTGDASHDECAGIRTDEEDRVFDQCLPRSGGQGSRSGGSAQGRTNPRRRAGRARK